MARPKPWSFSSLSTFKTCPRKYEAEVVLKSTPQRAESEAQLYGTRVHKAFEDHQRDGTELPVDLRMHQKYMDKLRASRIEGTLKVEHRVALNAKLEPCDFFARDANGKELVWWRGVIDYDAEVGHDIFHLSDYKTGKVKNDFTQLRCFALYKFMEGAQRVKTEYYWTQTQQAVSMPFDRSSIKSILASLEPDLAQYAEAFRSNIWQPRQNGLCKKWCDVKDCEFWGTGR